MQIGADVLYWERCEQRLSESSSIPIEFLLSLPMSVRVKKLMPSCSMISTLKSNIVPTNNGKNIRIMQLQIRHFYLVLSVSGEVVQLTQIMFITSTG